MRADALWRAAGHPIRNRNTGRRYLKTGRVRARSIENTSTLEPLFGGVHHRPHRNGARELRTEHDFARALGLLSQQLRSLLLVGKRLDLHLRQHRASREFAGIALADTGVSIDELLLVRNRHVA